jgi:protein-S-isoprenylcysteine O-methyltransferase Ste14
MPRPLRTAVAILIGLLIYAGLPLLGWGVLDAHGFIGHTARLGYLALVVVLQVALALRDPGLGREGGEDKAMVARQRWAVLILQILSLSVVLVAPFGGYREIGVFAEFEIGRYLGLVLIGTGFLFMNWAESTLGKHFSIQVTVQENHQRVTSGPYRNVRHPRYLGILLNNLGLALIFRSWPAPVLVAGPALVLLWRIRGEEALMHREFGSQWEAYVRRSWRLIPELF